MPEAKMTREVSLLRHDKYTKSSIFSDRVPRRRFQRQLSHSRIGLVSATPAYAIIRPPTPTRERKGKESLEEAMKNENVHQMWRYFMDLEPTTKPLTNRDLVQVGKKLTATLLRKLKRAMASDDEEQLRRAVEEADGRLQILKYGGLNVLREAKEKLGMNPDELPEVGAILGPAPEVKVRAPVVLPTRIPKPIKKKKALDTTAETIATEDLGEEGVEEEEEYEDGGEEAEAEEAEEAEEEVAEGEEVEGEECEEEAAEEAEEEAAEGDGWEDEECF